MSIIARLKTLFRRGSAPAAPASRPTRSRPHSHSREIERNLRRAARQAEKKD